MEFLSYFPYDIRSVILSKIPWTLSQIEEYRKYPTISHLLDRSVEHLIIREEISATELSRFPNLKIVEGEISIEKDLNLLSRLTSYSARFESLELLKTFLSSVSRDYFKNSSKWLRFESTELHFEDGEFSFIIYDHVLDEFSELLQIIIERQLFDRIVIEEVDAEEFAELFSTIQGLREVRLLPPSMGFPVILRLSGIWTQIESIVVDSWKADSPFIDSLLMMVRERYGKLPNVRFLLSFKIDSRYRIPQSLTSSQRDLAKIVFPNLKLAE